MKRILFFTKVSLLLILFMLIPVVHAQQVTGNLLTEAATSVDFDERSFYMLVNRETGQAMDVEGRSIMNDINIIVADADYSMHQVWRMDDMGGDVFNLANGHSDKVVRNRDGNVRQERRGSSNHHRWKIEHIEGTYFRLVNAASSNVVLAVDGNNVVGAAPNGSAAQQWQILRVYAEPIVPDFNLQGFASVGHGTTGGAGGDVVVVNNEADLIHYMQHQDPYIILIDGTITLGPGNHHSPSDNMHSIAPNKTLFGLEGATIKGGGFNIRGTRNNGVGEVTRSNIIIRNLTFEGPSPDDFINIEWGASHVWIDHNTFNGPNNDGIVDVKRESSFITISWNIINTNHKTMLLGHDDSHHHDRGFLKVTYHHNYIYNSQSRHPRMRYGRAHLFNNYFKEIGDYVMGPGIEAEIVSENNHVWESGRFTDWYHATGKVLERGQGSLINRINHDHDPRIVTSELEWGPEDYYSYTLYPALSVRDMVQTYAGAGVLSWGDPMPESYTLTSSVQGQGSVNPASGSFAKNSEVQITATPASGWQFDGWSGDASGTDNPLTLVMNSNKSVTATFIEIPGGGDNGDGQIGWKILYDWNFSAMPEYASNFSVSGSQIIAGVTLYNNIEVDGMADRSSEIDGVTYTYNRRVKFGGAGSFSGGNPTARVFAFPVSGDVKITVVHQSASSSEDRVLRIAHGANQVLETFTSPRSPHAMDVYYYTGDATTIYLYSQSSGINLYHVRVEEPDYGSSTTMKELQPFSKVVVSVNYYNLNGVNLGKNFDALPAGFYIKVKQFEDGSFKTKKVLKERR
ncbi:pectate lyase family protein [Natronoflexus pectinivorans]|uniref:Putative repeat protein (TIGR02543 family) n=1 Tax=Natronoflexus pectinivorans TaxID=682526 RepID=A0A4R2GJD9_9BACT|nr:RICIN domain-containing protein [Natronoflexus pectinivorans]TCO07460.1 putative repeat protein (TIGR02543 family) [Natronoflexus pectinivorans]